MFSKIFKNTLFFKKTICWILILAFLLQAIPDITQASTAKEIRGKINKFANWISKKFGEKILTVLPDEIYWTDDDDDDLVQLRISKRKSVLFEIPLRNILNDAVEGIKNIGESKIPIVDAEGKPRIPVPAIPSLCELRIMPPPEEQKEFLTIEERRLLNEACYGFLRLKRAAANQIFFSRHLYNKTDPLSDCFMLNCRTSCNIRLGRINYAISYMDILKSFVPGEILLKIKKIIDTIQRIAKIWLIIKPLYDLLKTLPKALKVLADTVVHGKAFLKSFRNVLRVANEDGLRKALSRFADNIMRFGNAQSSASAYISNAQMDTMDLIKELQKEPGVDFIFQIGDEYKTKRERAQKIIDDYILAGFETPRQIIDKFRRNGEFLEKEGYQNQGWIDANGHFKAAAPLMEEEEEGRGLCYNPTNRWLKYFKEFYLEQKDLADRINKNETPSPEQVARIIELKENLLVEIENLPKISDIEGPTEEEAGETMNFTSRKYWTTTTVEINCPGGELVNDGKYYFCRFSASACPPGWKPYPSTTQYWSTTIAGGTTGSWHKPCRELEQCRHYPSGSCSSTGCNEDSSGSKEGCQPWANTTFHSWENSPQETCTMRCNIKCDTGREKLGPSTTAYATITQIGCIPDAASAGEAEPMDANGQPTTPDQAVFYKFNGSGCPSGWTPYLTNGQQWTTTRQETHSIKGGNKGCEKSGGCGEPRQADEHCAGNEFNFPAQCHYRNCYDYQINGCLATVTTKNHLWGNQSPERCWQDCLAYWPKKWITASATAQITQIGCQRLPGPSPWVCDYDHNLVFYDWDGMIGLIQDKRNNEILRALLNAMQGASPEEISQFIDEPFLNWILDKKQKKLDEIINQLTDIKNSIPDGQINRDEVIQLIDSLISQAQRIKTKFEEIKTRVKEIKNIWSVVPQGELDYLQLKRNYVQDILHLIKESKELAKIIIAAENEFKQLKETGECLLKDDITSCFEALPPPPGADPMDSGGRLTTTEQAVFYRFNASACPAGWKPYPSTTQYWSTTRPFYAYSNGIRPGHHQVTGIPTQNECINYSQNKASNEEKTTGIYLAQCIHHTSDGCHGACSPWHNWNNKSFHDECVGVADVNEKKGCNNCCSDILLSVNNGTSWCYNGDCEYGCKKYQGTATYCMPSTNITQIGCVRSNIILSNDIKTKLKDIFGENGSLKEIENFLLPGPGAEEWAAKNLKDLIGEYKCEKCCPQCDQCDKDKCQDCEICQNCQRCPNCKEKKSFLNQIKCFEEENTKTFREILIFIDTMIRTQKLIPDLELIRGKILAIQPQLNLDYGCKPEDNFGDCMRKALADNPLGPTKKDFDAIKESIQNIRCKVFDIYSLTKGGIPMKEDGTPAITSEEAKFYKFSKYVCGRATCPDGWKPYLNWSTTEQSAPTDEYWDPEDCVPQGVKDKEFKGTCWYRSIGGGYCVVEGLFSSGWHSWSNKEREKCDVRLKCDCQFPADDKWGEWRTFYSKITEIGCVPKEDSLEYKNAKEIQMVLDAAKIKVNQKVNAIVDGISSLERKVFGDKEIRAGCGALDLILKGEPLEIEERCQCINLAGLEPMNENGQKVTDLTQTKFFRFNLSACPAGWKPYKNWSTTEQSAPTDEYWDPEDCVPQGVKDKEFKGTCWYRSIGGGYCKVEGLFSSGWHSWSNKEREKCEVRLKCDCQFPAGDKWGEWRTFYSKITQIGCVPDDPSIKIDEALLKFCEQQKQNEINERCSKEVIKTEMEYLFGEVVIGNDQESPVRNCQITDDKPLLDKCQNLQSKLLWDQIAKFEKIVFKGKTYNECAQENWDWKDDDYAEKCADKICERKKEKTGDSCGPFEYQNLQKEINEAKEFINKDQCPNLSLSGFESFKKTNGDYKKQEGMEQCVDNICRERADKDYSDNQRAIQAPCVFYQEVLQKALQNKCNDAKGQDNKNKCNTAREDIKKLIEHCPIWQQDPSSQENIPDLTLPTPSADNTLSPSESLEQVREVCEDEREDLITTLEEIYDIYWILLGIKSGELFFKGLLSSEKAITDIIKIAKEFDREKLKEIWNKIKTAWEAEQKEDIPKSGLEISISELIKCKSNPAVINPSTIYDPATGATRVTKGRTGSRGALVCPDITKLFAVIDGNFAALRQSLMELDLKKRKANLEEVYDKLKGRLIPNLEDWLKTNYPVKDRSSAYVQYLEELIDKAKDIKKQAQMVWVLSSAVNFAAANCTCGQSFCEFPVCISNLSLLTPEVFGNGYCYVVYIFRVPLRHAAAGLERMLLGR